MIWDVIVIGTGMGGATVGYELAKKGKSVLFLEKGQDLMPGTLSTPAFALDESSSDTLDDSPESRLARGLWPVKLRGRTTFGETEFFAPLGCGTGGSGNLYAAQLERMMPEDFEPKKHYPEAHGASLPERWPIRYTDFLPYYRKAEELFRVKGSQDPLNSDADSRLMTPPLLSPKDQDLFESLKDLGLHPYRAHVASEFIEDCGECGGVICPQLCKNDPRTVCLEPAMRVYGAKLMANCEVVRLEANAKTVTNVVCEYEGNNISFRGKRIVLAAGALNTPALLLKSRSEIWPQGLANTSGMVGRHLMWHASDFLGLFPLKLKKYSSTGPKKTIAINDFYIHPTGKLGTIQSVGVPINAHYIKSFLNGKFSKSSTWIRSLSKFLPISIISEVAGKIFKNTSVFATIVEDLPYFDNRILIDSESETPYFHYKYTSELGARSKTLRKNFSEVLGSKYITFRISGRNNINFGHACGTCRFGEDPKQSVINVNNRCHDLDNLYIADSSFFPTSGGTNPSLTIAANAIRVAEAIDLEDINAANEIQKVEVIENP